MRKWLALLGGLAVSFGLLAFLALGIPASAAPGASSLPAAPPLPPTSPDPADGATNQPYSELNLSWTGDALTYTVFLKAGSPPGSTDLACPNVSSASCIVHSLAISAPYHWSVRACNGADCVSGPDWSFTTANIKSFLPFVRLPLPSPVLQPIDNPFGDPNYRVAWGTSQGADVYLLQEAGEPGFLNPTQVYLGPNTFFDFSSRQQGTYYYRVKARSASGDSVWSNVQSTVLGPPGVPYLQPINNPTQSGNFLLTWAPAPRARSYDVQEIQQWYSMAIVHSAGGSTSYAVSGSGIGPYAFSVRAENYWGTSAYGNVQTTIVAGQGISGLTTGSGGQPSSDLRLQLRRCDATGCITQQETVTSGGSYSFQGAPSLQAGQSYYVRYANGSRGGNPDDTQYLWDWWGPDITAYAAGQNVWGGNMSLGNIGLISPADGAAVNLPATFSWATQPWPMGSMSYALELFSLTSSAWWDSPLTGAGYTLTVLPSGFTSGVPYGWTALVVSPWGGYGDSYDARAVTFNTGASGPRGQPTPGNRVDLTPSVEAARVSGIRR